MLLLELVRLTSNKFKQHSVRSLNDKIRLFLIIPLRSQKGILLEEVLKYTIRLAKAEASLIVVVAIFLKFIVTKRKKKLSLKC